jgi:competence protein ComEA
VPPSSDPFDPFEPTVGGLDSFDVDRVPRPLPGGSLVARLVARARPWAEWFGVRRLIAVAVAVVAVVAGGWWLLRAPAPPTEAGLPFAATTTAAAAAAGPGSTTVAASGSVAATTTVATSVVVDVAGAVVQPGVYVLPGGARTHAAVDAAGGARPDADLAAVNLAAPLVDGSQVYVPVVGALPRVGAPPGPSVPATVPGPVDINRASAAELDALPGIGPSTAQAIVEHRDANGPFASVDDLQDVRGIGPAKLEAIRGLVTL